MALTVETGEGLENADSFVELVEVRAFATSRGVTLPTDDSELEVLVRKAHDYLLFQEPRFQGRRTTATQALPFPRCGVVLYGTTVEDNVIPVALKTAVCQIVNESLNVEELLPASTEKPILQETVGPLTTRYADTGVATPLPILPKVLAYLSIFFRNSGITTLTRV